MESGKVYLNSKDIEISLVNTPQITFEITDICNLNCTYCAYGSFYFDYDVRENKRLSPNRAILLLEYLSKLWNSPLNVSSMQNVYISFYGGEPLLNMPFIRTVVDYVENKLVCNTRNFTFSMTTNALLLHKNMDFLVAHNFNLLISLDGDKESTSYRLDHKGNPAFETIIDLGFDMQKPINLLPILNLQDDVDRIRQDKEHEIGEKSLHYLNELNIYLNNSCSLNCLYCKLYSKQIKSCYKEKKNTNIQPVKIKEILDSLVYSSLKKINFLGGNIFLYPYLNELNELLKDFDINNYQIYPIYTGSNISFFENNIYLGKEDIFATLIPHRIIFCNQKLNSNYFGKLFVLSDGSIKANMNTQTIGNIYENSLLEAIAKELDKNTAWRVIRDKKPCNQCLYQCLCPLPSNYETVIILTIQTILFYKFPQSFYQVQIRTVRR